MRARPRMESGPDARVELAADPDLEDRVVALEAENNGALQTDSRAVRGAVRFLESVQAYRAEVEVARGRGVEQVRLTVGYRTADVDAKSERLQRAVDRELLGTLRALQPEVGRVTRADD